MSLVAVWSEASLLHDPGGEVWIGLPIDGDETADRGQALRRAIDEASLRVVGPSHHPDSTITAIHDPGMLSYLSGAWEDWVAAGYPGEHGQAHVVPYAFRHPRAFDYVQHDIAQSKAARAGTYCLDTCTTLGPGSYGGIRYAVDASLTAADLVIAGGTDAYAAVRPPGHHAGSDYFGGSCYLNNAAITAQYLVESGVGRVGIVDIDAHHGNGTQHLFYHRDDVVYTSVHIDPATGWYPHWSGFADEIGEGLGSGMNLNIPLSPGDGDTALLSAVERLVSKVVATSCEVLVVSLGVDAAAADENSPLVVSTDGFARAADALAAAGRPTILIQEGGYHLPSLQRDLTAILTRFSVAR